MAQFILTGSVRHLLIGVTLLPIVAFGVPRNTEIIFIHDLSASAPLTEILFFGYQENTHPLLKGAPTINAFDETYVLKDFNPDITLIQEFDNDGTIRLWSWVRTQGAGRVFYTASVFQRSVLDELDVMREEIWEKGIASGVGAIVVEGRVLSVSAPGIVTQVGGAVGQDLVANGDGEVLFRVRTSVGHIVKSDTGALTMNRAGRFTSYAELAGSATASDNEALSTAGPWSPQVHRLGPTKA